MDEDRIPLECRVTIEQTSKHSEGVRLVKLYYIGQLVILNGEAECSTQWDFQRVVWIPFVSVDDRRTCRGRGEVHTLSYVKPILCMRRGIHGIVHEVTEGLVSYIGDFDTRPAIFHSDIRICTTRLILHNGHICIPLRSHLHHLLYLKSRTARSVMPYGMSVEERCFTYNVCDFRLQTYDILTKP